MAKVFISHRRADPDMRLATFLEEGLEKLGHSVFRDVDIYVGQRWAQRIATELSACDFFIILISEQSMDRDMVRQEVQTVYEINKKQGKPSILPVRMRYTGALPYDMGARLDPLHYAVWDSERDDHRLVDELAKAMSGAVALPHQYEESDVDRTELLRITEKAGKPLPKAEPTSDVVALAAENPFYVEREVDNFFYGSLRWTMVS